MFIENDGLWKVWRCKGAAGFEQAARITDAQPHGSCRYARFHNEIDELYILKDDGLYILTTMDFIMNTGSEERLLKRVRDQVTAEPIIDPNNRPQ